MYYARFIPIWVMVWFCFPKSWKDAIIQNHWDYKSNERIIDSYVDAQGWVELKDMEIKLYKNMVYL